MPPTASFDVSDISRGTFPSNVNELKSHQIQSVPDSAVDDISDCSSEIRSREEDASTEDERLQSSHYFDALENSILHDRYRVVTDINQGRFSEVHECIDLQSPDCLRKVALKIFRSSSEYYEAYLNELKLYNHLCGQVHQRVITAEDHFIIETDRGTHGVIVFPLLKNDVKRWLDEEHQLPLATVHKIIIQVADGLQFLHNAGIIHADIKPENLLLDHDENIKICDIGSGMILENIDSFHVGTIPYISPELILGVPYDTKIDVWALGCLMFELLAGECLFDPEMYFEPDTDANSDSETESESSEGNAVSTDRNYPESSSSDDEQSQSVTIEPHNTGQSKANSKIQKLPDLASVSRKPSKSSRDNRTSIYSDYDDEGYEWEVNHFQLCAFKNVLGRIPQQRFEQGKYYTTFYGPNGRLRCVPRCVDDRSIHSILREDFDFSEEDATNLERDLLKILIYEPEKRPSCSDVINMINTEYGYST